MPMTKKGRVLRGMKAVLATALAAAALPAAASADAGDCAPISTSQVFLASGDLGYYFLAPGGDFEQRGVWNMTGSYGYERYDGSILPWAGSTALRLDDRARASSPVFCVDSTYPHVRLGAQAIFGSGTSTLTVEAVSADGTAVALGTLRGSDFRDRALTTELPLASKLNLATGEHSDVQIRLSAKGGSWGADAVSVDPRSAR